MFRPVDAIVVGLLLFRCRRNPALKRLVGPSMTVPPAAFRMQQYSGHEIAQATVSPAGIVMDEAVFMIIPSNTHTAAAGASGGVAPARLLLTLQYSALAGIVMAVEP